MEFLETFGCIWSSKEVIRVIFGRALPGATSRSDYMKSLCPTSRSDFPRATARSRSRFHVRRHTDLTLERPPRATCRSRSRCSERPVGATHQGRSRPLVRRHQNRASWSDPSERPTKVAPSQSDQPERPAQVARILTGRDTKKRVGSDLLGATMLGRSACLIGRFLCYFRGLLVICFIVFRLPKPKLSTGGATREKQSIFWRTTSKTSFDSDFIAFILCSC